MTKYHYLFNLEGEHIGTTELVRQGIFRVGNKLFLSVASVTTIDGIDFNRLGNTDYMVLKTQEYRG